MKENQSSDLIKLKILLLGRSGCGKSCIRERYCNNKFASNFLATTGLDIRIKIFQFEKYKIKLMINDTPGVEGFRYITKMFYKNDDGIIFVCDITDYRSLDEMIFYEEDLKKANINYESIICANKCDSENKRKIKKEDLEKYGKSKNIEVFEVSAKTGKNINEAFNRLVELIIRKKYKDKEILENMNNEKFYI